MKGRDFGYVFAVVGVFGAVVGLVALQVWWWGRSDAPSTSVSEDRATRSRMTRVSEVPASRPAITPVPEASAEPGRPDDTAETPVGREAEGVPGPTSRPRSGVGKALDGFTRTLRETLGDTAE